MNRGTEGPISRESFLFFASLAEDSQGGRAVFPFFMLLSLFQDVVSVSKDDAGQQPEACGLVDLEVVTSSSRKKCETKTEQGDALPSLFPSPSFPFSRE